MTDAPKHVQIGRYTAFFIEHVTQLPPHIDAWSRLASSTSNPNVYYSPEFLIPNLEHIEHRPFVLMLIYDQTTTYHAPTLIAFAPFTVNMPCPRRPFVHLKGLTNAYVFRSDPLIDPRYSGAAWDVLFQLLQDASHAWHLTDLLCEAELDGLPPALVHQVAAGHTISCRNEVDRAWLHKPQSFDDFVGRLTSKARRNYRRSLRQLGDLGAVTFQLHRRCEDVVAVIDDFLALERSSWKGCDGGAMANKSGHAEFLHKISHNLNAQGGLFYIEMRLDRRLVAVSLAHAQGSTLFAFKITYDEKFKRYSPGVIVAVETVRRFIEDPKLTAAHAGNSVESWIRRYYTNPRVSYRFCVPTRRPLALSFSWGLKCFGRLRGVEMGKELAAQHQEFRGHT